MKPKVSVVIPCNGYERYILTAVKSVLKIKDISKEIVIVLYGDSAETVKISKLKKNKEIKIFKFYGKSIQMARNIGICCSMGSVVIPLDADDIIITFPSNSSYLNKAYTLLMNNANLAFITGISYMFNDKIGITSASYPVNEKDVIFKSHVKTSIAFRKSDFVNDCFYYPDILKWQDWSFAVSLLNHRFKNHKNNDIYFINDVVHGYRVYNKGTISKSNVSEYEMVKRTIFHEPEIYRHYLRGYSLTKMANIILSSKPTLLEDILGIASIDKKRAEKFITRLPNNYYQIFNSEQISINKTVYKELFPHNYYCKKY